ncbi:MAG: universal stress protein [Sphingomonas bacterium]
MHHVLVATDLTSKSAAAVERGCALAVATCASLHLLHVRGHGGHRSASEQLAAIGRDVAAQNPCIAQVTHLVRTGRVAQAIRQAADDVAADIVVVGGHGGARLIDELFPTTAERLTRALKPPLLVVRNSVTGGYRRVLAAVERGAAAREVLKLACMITSADRVFAVHAFMPSVFDLMRDGGDQARATAQHELEQIILETLGARCDLAMHIEPVVLAGEAVSVVLQAWSAYKPDLLALATHGRTGFALGLHGSFTDVMIENDSFDLLIHHVPADEDTKDLENEVVRHAV